MTCGAGIAHRVPGVTVLTNPRHAPAERDIAADLVAPLAALRRLDGDGDAAVTLVTLLGDETRARIARELCRRPALFGAPVIRAVLASTPKPVLGRMMGPQAALAAWRCYVGP